MTYAFLQHYWWFLVSLLGALLVFLMFVQGANALLFSLGRNEKERALLVNSTGRNGSSRSQRLSPLAERSSHRSLCSTVQVSAAPTGCG